MVFNTDTIKGNGEHWFVMLFMVENDNLDAEIFDSQRSVMEKNIITFAECVVKRTNE